jgi:antitoxin (DNA-binding transcriptional repressor) of toxin-antitoxin stability system
VSMVTPEDAQARRVELVHRLAPGEGVTITGNGRPMPVATAEAPRPVAGLCRGMLAIVTDDDAHLTDWAESLA